MYIDTHAHLTFPEFQIDLPEVIRRAKEANIEAIVNIALDDEATSKSIKMAEEYPDFIFNAVGLHPHDASQWNAETYDKLKEITEKNKIVAIGETGLDYHYKLSPIEQQQMVFRKLLRLAQELDVPAVIHSREAAEDTIKIIREENRGNLKGVMHCFSGDMDLGRWTLDMGLYISFTGNITFPKANIVREAAKQIPLDRLMIETDCPFLAPQEFRGKRNEPAYVIKVAEKIAEIKSLSLEEIAMATTRNAIKLFGI